MHLQSDGQASPLLGSDFPLPLESPFTCQQAASAGVSRHALSGLVVEGLVRRLLRGVYVPAQTPDSLELRTQALALVVPTDAVLVDWTACWLWTGVLAPGEHLVVPPVSLFRPAGSGRLRNRLCRSGERAFLHSDLAEVGGLHVTTPLRTTWDLGRFFHRDIAVGGMDALLRHGTFDLDDVLGGLERFRAQRGVVPLRELAPLLDGRSESPGESTLRLRWHDLPSLPQPKPQVVVTDASGRELARVDLGIDELRFGVEYDGQEFHSIKKDRDHDAERRAWLEREYGWLIKAVRRENVYGPTRDVECIIREGIVEARRTLTERAQRFTRQ